MSFIERFSMDQELVAGDFLNRDLPKDQRYLEKYFRTDIQRQFLKYYLTFHSAKRFAEHTGRPIDPEWARRLVIKLDQITEAHQNARQQGDFEVLSDIEAGTWCSKAK